jgi:hypothetical protein
VRGIGFSTGPYDRMSRGYVPQDKLRWLDSLVCATPPTQPVLFFAHYPLNDQMSNAREVMERLHRFRTQAFSERFRSQCPCSADFVVRAGGGQARPTKAARRPPIHTYSETALGTSRLFRQLGEG